MLRFHRSVWEQIFQEAFNLPGIMHVLKWIGRLFTCSMISRLIVSLMLENAWSLIRKQTSGSKRLKTHSWAKVGQEIASWSWSPVQRWRHNRSLARKRFSCQGCPTHDHWSGRGSRVPKVQTITCAKRTRRLFPRNMTGEEFAFNNLLSPASL